MIYDYKTLERIAQGNGVHVGQDGIHDFVVAGREASSCKFVRPRDGDLVTVFEGEEADITSDRVLILPR